MIFCRSNVSFTTEVPSKDAVAAAARKVDFAEKHDTDLLLVICHGHFSLGINKQKCLSCFHFFFGN